MAIYVTFEKDDAFSVAFNVEESELLHVASDAQADAAEADAVNTAAVTPRSWWRMFTAARIRDRLKTLTGANRLGFDALQTVGDFLTVTGSTLKWDTTKFKTWLAPADVDQWFIANTNLGQVNAGRAAFVATDASNVPNTYTDIGSSDSYAFPIGICLHNKMFPNANWPAHLSSLADTVQPSVGETLYFHPDNAYSDKYLQVKIASAHTIANGWKYYKGDFSAPKGKPTASTHDQWRLSQTIPRTILPLTSGDIEDPGNFQPHIVFTDWSPLPRVNAKNNSDGITRDAANRIEENLDAVNTRILRWIPSEPVQFTTDGNHWAGILLSQFMAYCGQPGSGGIYVGVECGMAFRISQIASDTWSSWYDVQDNASITPTTGDFKDVKIYDHTVTKGSFPQIENDNKSPAGQKARSFYRNKMYTGRSTYSRPIDACFPVSMPVSIGPDKMFPAPYAIYEFALLLSTIKNGNAITDVYGGMSALRVIRQV